MTSTELSKLTGVSRQAIEKKRDKAIEQGAGNIEVDGTVYVFTYERGRYEYEVHVPKTVEVKHDAEEMRYTQLPEAKRKEAELRLDLVREYENRGDMSYKEFMRYLPRRFRKLKFSKRQFERWLKAVRECPPNKTPLAYLVDKRGRYHKEKILTDEIKTAIAVMIQEKPHRKIRRVYEYLQRDFEQVPSYETVRRYVEKWKSENAFYWDFATNPDRAKGKLKPALGSMSEAIHYPNQMWELDATPADIICSDGKRYVISAAIDVYSRRPVAVVEESADYSTLAKVMRKGIKKFGVPETVKVDNGKDYTGNYFDATCSRLRINKIVVPPYSGEYKPHIERFFRTLSMQLFEEMEGFVGHNVAEKEALQNQKSFQARQESIKRFKEAYKDGNEFAARFGMKKENAGIDVRIPMSKEELELWIDRWIVTYENRRHGGIKTTPMKRWRLNMHEIRTISDDRTLDMLLGVSEQRTIGKKGITFKSISYHSEFFGDRVGERVWVLTDDDLGSIYVYDLKMNYICTARNAAYENQSRYVAMKATKRYDKKMRKYIKALEELRAEAPQRMQEMIADELGIAPDEAFKPSEVTKAQMDAIAEVVDDALDEKRTVEAEVRINGRPTFTKFYDRQVLVGSGERYGR